MAGTASMLQLSPFNGLHPATTPIICGHSRTLRGPALASLRSQSAKFPSLVANPGYLSSLKVRVFDNPAQYCTFRHHNTRRQLAVAQGASDMSSAPSVERGGTVVREVLDRAGRSKLDPGSDRDFYAYPRMVTHVDESFLRSLTQLYRERLPAGGEILDLMSSWVSHLPPEVRYQRVVGHGMNGKELLKNPRLDSFFLKDLNEDQKFEAADQSFDAVICTVSVQYLQQPEKVFAEIYRILRPGGVCIMSFSNRMFYDKAIGAWRDTSGYGRIQLVRQYFQCVRGFTEPEVVTEVKPDAGSNGGTPNPGGPLKFFENVAKLMQRSAGDPFYAVIAYRNFKRVD